MSPVFGIFRLCLVFAAGRIPKRQPAVLFAATLLLFKPVPSRLSTTFGPRSPKASPAGLPGDEGSLGWAERVQRACGMPDGHAHTKHIPRLGVKRLPCKPPSEPPLFSINYDQGPADTHSWGRRHPPACWGPFPGFSGGPLLRSGSCPGDTYSPCSQVSCTRALV